MKHTKGNWRSVKYIDNTISVWSGYERLGGKIVTEIMTHNSTEEEAEANARLIASSPELLSCLVKILNWHKAHDAISFLETEAIKEAEQVIAKATGEPINS